MKSIPHPSGDRHWTRLHPEYRQPWAKLHPEQIDDLCRRFQDGESQSALARQFRVGRTTVWRYLRARGLIGKQGVSRVSRVSSDPRVTGSISGV